MGTSTLVLTDLQASSGLSLCNTLLTVGGVGELYPAAINTFVKLLHYADHHPIRIGDEREWLVLADLQASSGLSLCDALALLVVLASSTSSNAQTTTPSGLGTSENGW
jgi:hypothetical protein